MLTAIPTNPVSATNMFEPRPSDQQGKAGLPCTASATTESCSIESH